MKRLQDITQRNTTGDDSVSVAWVSRKTQVIEETKWNIFYDISNNWDTDIHLGKKTEILLNKRRWKNFDSLEKKKSWNYFKSSDVIIPDKKEDFSFISYYIRCKRFISQLTTGWLILFSLLCVLGLLLLWFTDKVIVENRVNAGYEKLIQVREGGEMFDGIQKNVNAARFDLLIADSLFFPFKIFPWEKIDSVSHVISGGRYLSKALDSILALYSEVNDFTKQKPLKEIYFTQLLQNIRPKLLDIEKSLTLSLGHYKNIEWLPSRELELQKEGSIIKIERLLDYIKAINGNYDALLALLWHDERKRYLIVFQNADEIRPTWWFMWSMWLLEVFRGRVQLFQKKDVYAIEWDLKKAEYNRLPAPKGINELTDTFGLRDANYYVNVHDSSETIRFFLNEAGIDLDGIVYINQNSLLRILKLTWPIYFPQLEREIDHTNFSELMSLVVEAKTFKTWTLGTPKQVLFDFMEVFTEELIRQWRYFDYMQSIIHDMNSRDIMVWSFEAEQNNLLTNLWINGNINYDKNLDFIYPVYTSLSWNKSDRYISRKYNHTVVSGDSCSYDVKFSMQMTHTMWNRIQENIEKEIERYGIETDNILQIQWAAKNRQFMRMILPNNAIIEENEKYAIVDYGQRKWIEFFLDTEPWETSFFEIEYSLPNPECRNYDMTFYNQPGIPQYNISINIDGQTYDYVDRKEDFYFEKRE